MGLEKNEEYGVVVPILTKDEKNLPQFLLTDGNLTFTDGSYAGIYPDLPEIDLKPLVFSDDVEGKDGADFVAVTRDRTDGSGRTILTLFALNGREFGTLSFFEERNRGRSEIRS